MGWSDTARHAAAAEYGRANWRRYAARRRTGWTILLLAAVVLVGGRAAARTGWSPDWGLIVTWAAIAAVAAVLLVVVVKMLGSPYRVRRRRRY